MKARAVVFTHVQRPFTIWGFPPKMVGIAASGAMAAWVICVGSGFAGAAMLVAAGVMALELAGCYWLGKSDHHIVSVLLLATTFWRTSPRRWLLAGVPAMRSRGGRS
jgi:hypothetical protein